MPYDVTGLRPEARIAGEAAARTLHRHLGDDLVSVVAYGSAVKGGIIAGCSDLDLRGYVAPARMAAEGSLSTNTALRLYQDLAQIETRPFRYLQIYLAVADKGAGKAAGGTGFIAGAYHVIYGDTCVPLATAAELRRGARTALSRLDAEAAARRIGERLLSGGRPSYAQELRWLCTDVWPVLYHMLTLAGDDPLGVWRLPKPDAIARTDPESEPGRTIRLFARALATHYATGEALPTALAALEVGIAFLRAAQHWYANQEAVG